MTHAEEKQMHDDLQRYREALAVAMNALSEIGSEAVAVLVKHDPGDDPVMMAPWVAGTANGALNAIDKVMCGIKP